MSTVTAPLADAHARIEALEADLRDVAARMGRSIDRHTRQCVSLKKK